LAQQLNNAPHSKQVNPTFAASQDGEITHFIEEVATPSNVYDLEACQEKKYQAIDDIGEAAVVIDQVINLGKKIWTIVEKGKPVLEAKYSYANALPKGVRSSIELDQFSPLQARSFRVYGKNGFGMTVYDVTYTLVHRYGGTYDGRGRYLDNVAVLPQSVNVLWGYKLNLDVTNVSTVNIGTKSDPVAGITMELTLKVSTVMKASEERAVFDFHGDNAKVIAIQ